MSSQRQWFLIKIAFPCNSNNLVIPVIVITIVILVIVITIVIPVTVLTISGQEDIEHEDTETAKNQN